MRRDEPGGAHVAVWWTDDPAVDSRAFVEESVASELALHPDQVDTWSGRHGRPVVRVPGTATIEVSVAHAGGLTLVAVAGSLVGIDVEPHDALVGVELADHVCTRREQRLLGRAGASERSRQLARWWVRKEAALKALGLGLHGRPDSVDVSTPGRVRLTRELRRASGVGGTLSSIDLDLSPRHFAALVIEGPGPPAVALRSPHRPTPGGIPPIVPTMADALLLPSCSRPTTTR